MFELLPSPIEDKVHYKPMKRSPPSPGPGSSSPGSSPANSDDETHHEMPEEIDEQAYREKYKLGLAKFWAAKAAALQEPFDYAGPSRPPLSLRTDYDGVIKDFQAEKPTKYEATENYQPLSGDAIAAILKQTKPDCPKAQSWIKAHEFSKLNKERMNAKMKERECLRRKVFDKLRVKTLDALRESNASKEEVREILSMLPPKETYDSEMDCDEDDDADEDADEEHQQMIRVQKASARLQDLVFDDQGAGSANFSAA